MASGPEIYLAAGLTILLSLVVGGALCAHERRGWSWLAPGCGFAAIMSIAWIAVRLPGDGHTAGVLILFAGIASAWRLRGRIEWRRLIVGLFTAGLALAAVSLPFAANRRFGALGATINDDLALHLEFADILALGDDASTSVDIAYPVGPHSVVAALSNMLGMSIESAFVGLIIAVPVIAALTALAALDHLPTWVQPIGAVLVGLCYLSAAFTAQASFKETVIATLVLTFAVVLRELARDRSHWRRWLLPMTALVLGGLGAFSVPALVWFMAVATAVLVVTMVVEGIRPSRRFALGGVGVFLALLAAVAVFELLTSFFRLGPGRLALSASEGARGGAGGNLLGPLSFFEALGVWPSADFRLDPAGEDWRLGVALAVIATLAGVAISAVRREWELLAAAGVSIAIYVVVTEVSLAYNAAKALVIAAPLIMLTAVSGLLVSARPHPVRTVLALLMASFAVAAGASSTLALRGGIVRPDTQAEAFRQLRAHVKGKPTIFLGRENYAAWELRTTRIGYMGVSSRASRVGLMPNAGAAPTRGLDSLATEELEAAELLVAPNTLYASLPGPEFKEVLRNRWYRLYRRTRPSRPRYVLGERAGPGATLNCSTPRGRSALRVGGRAFVRPAPVVGRVGAWTFPPHSGQPPPGSTVVVAGNEQTIEQSVDLPPGRWEISLSWASSIPIRARIDGRLMTLPPYIGDGERHWRVASVRGGRAVEVVLYPGGERRIDVGRAAQVGTIAAVREDVRGRFMPVKRACGRYVDWIER